MKKFKLIFVFILLLTTCKEPEVSMKALEVSEVDKRVELLSIVFRLAGNEEYNQTKFTVYTDNIFEHFEKYKYHSLIKFTKKLRKRNGVAYDAVMNMAIHLDDNLNPLVGFSDEVPEKRWGKRNAKKFIRLLKQFYVDADCESFFKKNHHLYAQTSKNIQPLIEKIDISWFHSFYGEAPKENFKVIAGLGIGHGNYGPHINYPNGQRGVYAILGVWNFDENGNPTFPAPYYFPTLIHEFSHSFVNHHLDKNPDPYKKSGAYIFGKVEKRMRSQAYTNWKTMINEALVRASVIKYMKDHEYTQEAIRSEIQRQKNRGFLWIEELLKELENYDANRMHIPAISDTKS